MELEPNSYSVQKKKPSGAVKLYPCRMRQSLSLLLKQSRVLHNQKPKNIIDAFGSGTHSHSDEISFTRTFNKIMQQSIPSLNTNKKSISNTTQSIIDDSKDLFNQFNSAANANLKDSKILYQINPINDKLKKTHNGSIDDYEFNREYLNLEKKTQLSHSLQPTLNKLNSFDNDYDLMEFLQNIILKFNKESSSKKSRKTNVRFNDALLKEISSESRNSPSEPLLNQFTLPMLLERGIHLLATKFESPQEAITIFEMVKNLNLRTFIYCVTIEIYNEVLKIYWNDYKDISTIYYLIDELKINGVQGNLATVQILNKISIETHKLLNGESENDNGFVDFSVFDLEKGMKLGQREGALVYNKKDEDILLSVDQFIHDLNRTINL